MQFMMSSLLKKETINISKLDQSFVEISKSEPATDEQTFPHFNRTFCNMHFCKTFNLENEEDYEYSMGLAKSPGSRNNRGSKRAKSAPKSVYGNQKRSGKASESSPKKVQAKKPEHKHSKNEESKSATTEAYAAPTRINR
eukprot:gene8334-158_t